MISERRKEKVTLERKPANIPNFMALAKSKLEEKYIIEIIVKIIESGMTNVKNILIYTLTV